MGCVSICIKLYNKYKFLFAEYNKKKFGLVINQQGVLQKRAIKNSVYQGGKPCKKT
jgi:hypothetical protein